MKAVIFDMDGVIALTEELHFISIQRIMREVYKKELDAEGFIHYIGRSEEDTWQGIMDSYGVKGDISYLMQLRLKEIVPIMRERVKHAAGLQKLLDDLRSHDVRMAVASSSEREVVDAVLSSLRIDKYFEIVCGGDDVRHKKPAPDLYLLALEKLGVQAEEAVAIEDSPSGIRAAKGAGLRCVGVGSTLSEEKLKEADMFVRSLEELNYEKLRKLA